MNHLNTTNKHYEKIQIISCEEQNTKDKNSVPLSQEIDWFSRQDYISFIQGHAHRHDPCVYKKIGTVEINRNSLVLVSSVKPDCRHLHSMGLVCAVYVQPMWETREKCDSI